MFLQKMGAFQDVPFLGSAFNTWWPLILVLFCLVLALNLGERLSRALGITRFDFAAAAGDAADDEHTERGRQLLRREQEVRGWPPQCSSMFKAMQHVSTWHSSVVVPPQLICNIQAALRGMKPGDILHLFGNSDAPPTIDATAHMRSALRSAALPFQSMPDLACELRSALSEKSLRLLPTII